jgi:two-component system, cell cycle sensor histidine kinase and response regulator CckA
MKSHHVLIVDDKEENLYFLKSLLRGHGYEVMTAIHGEDALDKALENTPDLIISDILMPVMDGFAFCRECRKDGSLKNIPFVFYTATYTDSQDEAFAREIGADEFITKPCEPENLLNAICRALEKGEHRDIIVEQAPKREEDIFKLYNKRLIHKLEQKMIELEQEVITRKTAEATLRESEEKHRRLFETMPHGIVYQNPDGKITYANPAAEKILGLTFAQMQGRISDDPQWRAIHENGTFFPGDSHPSMVALRTGKPVIDVVLGIYNPRQNARRWIKASAIPLFKSKEDMPCQVYTAFEDITDYKELQSQFIQSQKMEAIGALAGGVAHDFNNLLTVIKGYAEILIENLPSDASMREDAMHILRAGKQAASLTSQLLAFSRKQMIQPKILRLNDIVDEVGKMLHRLLGENIQLGFNIQRDLGMIQADPGQIQQILMNLAVNARDAMPKGGKLDIRTADIILDESYIPRYPFVKPGAYVMLAISDTGVGIDDATQLRIFEPFFTTKTQGTGTGLGLSTVYGIVKQSNGFIWVDSEPGKGASFKIFFPRVEGEADPLDIQNISDLSTRNNETVLLAEDESSVRALVARILREQSYTVLEASNGREALDVALAYKGTIHLILTDSVMPVMSGKELVSQLGNQRPGIKVLYVSGYTNSGIVHKDILDSGVAFLQKPFTGEQLIRKIQSVLNS